MKPAGLILLLPAGWGLIAAEPAPDRLSPRLSEELRLSLPKYVAPAAPADAADDNSAAPDPDLVVLPKMVIQEKRLPGNDPDAWLGPREVQRKALAAYKGSMSRLDWALNSWFIPLVSPPASARARAAYESAKIRDEVDRLNSIINAIEAADPKAATRLRRAMDPNRLPKDD